MVNDAMAMQFYIFKRITSRWLFTIILCSCFVNIPTGLAWEIPYGVQDPLLGSGGWQNCEGHEIGYWNVVQRTAPDGRTAIFLVLTAVDMIDPAFVICIVPPDRKIMVMEQGKKL